jgi:hypothetical protein
MPRRRDGAYYLFHDYDLRAVCDNHQEQMKNAIENADGHAIRSGDLDALTEAYVAQFGLDVPQLAEGATSVEVEEAQVDVSHDPRRFIRDRDEPFYVSGIRATYFVPYTGDGDLFKCRPSTFTTVIPAVTNLLQDELVFAVERPDQNVAATKQAFEGELSRVKEYLAWVRHDSETFNASLPAEARRLLTARRQRLAQMDQGTQSLGVPVRKTGAPRGSAPSRPSAPPPKRVVEKYDAALSFAGEDREYVEAVAQGLKDAGISVFYDRFEAAGLWGKNLVDHLADIYKNRSRYVVMFVSKHYVAKPWATHERQHAQDRALVANEEYILPARFDDTEVPGMTNTVAYISLKDLPPARLVELILMKLGKSAR